MFERVCLYFLECYNWRWCPARHYQGSPFLYMSDAPLGNTHPPKLLTFHTHSLCACQSDNVYFVTTSPLHTNWRSYWTTCKSNKGRVLQKRWQQHYFNDNLRLSWGFEASFGNVTFVKIYLGSNLGDLTATTATSFQFPWLLTPRSLCNFRAQVPCCSTPSL